MVTKKQEDATALRSSEQPLGERWEKQSGSMRQREKQRVMVWVVFHGIGSSPLGGVFVVPHLMAIIPAVFMTCALNWSSPDYLPTLHLKPTYHLPTFLNCQSLLPASLHCMQHPPGPLLPSSSKQPPPASFAQSLHPVIPAI